MREAKITYWRDGRAFEASTVAARVHEVEARIRRVYQPSAVRVELLPTTREAA